MTSLFDLAMRLRTRALPTPRKAKPTSIAKSVAKKTPPLKEGRRSADRRVQEPHRKGMRRASFLLSPHAERTEAQDFIELGPHGAGALAFRRPTAASEVLASARLEPRFLEPPDANGRTLSGTSAASTSQSGTRRTGRCPSRPRAQCIAALHENRSRSALRSTLAIRRPSRAGFWVSYRYGDGSSRALSLYQGHRKCLHQRRTRLGAPLFKFVIRIVLFFEATQIAKSERRIAQRSLPSDAGCSCMAPRIFLRNLIE